MIDAASRRGRIREARLAQPIEELERKARKAVSRSNLWQREELDLGIAKGRSLHSALKSLWIAA